MAAAPIDSPEAIAEAARVQLFMRVVAQQVAQVQSRTADAMLEALGPWLAHAPGCAVGEGGGRCDCGLWAAVAACRGGSDA